jgi:DNA polymerase-3 subunit gamma/tau
MHDILAGGVAIEQFVVDMAEYFRNVLFLKHGIRRQHLLGYPPSQFRQEVVDAFSPEQLEKAVELFMELYRRLKYTLSPMFELELVMSRLSDLARRVSPGEVLDAIGRARAELGQRRSPRAAAAAERTAAPRPSATPHPAASPVAASGGADRERWAQVVEACKKEKPLLGSALDKASSQQVTERSVVISFRTEDRFHAEMVEAELSLLSAKASSIVGRMLSVEVKIEPGEKRETAPDDRVELVKRIFRGEIVEGGG